MTDKERDDALIAEALMGVVNATRAYLPPDGIDEKTCINRILEATDNPEMARIIQRIEERQPKPDRAEALAWMIEGLFAEAADNPCTCASDENSCPHCNAWERATKQTRACIVEAIDELRAEWEAERPVIEVPIQVKAWAEGIGSVIPPTDEVREWIKSLPIGATDRSPRSRLHRLEM